MAIDLFALRANLEVTGLPQAQAGLRSLNVAGAQTAASFKGVSGGSLEVTRNIMAQEAATRALSARKTALSGTLNRISRDINVATADFKAGRISVTDHATALAFARSEATKLGSATSMTGPQLRAYTGILNATAAQTNLAAKGTGFLSEMMGSSMARFMGVTAVLGMARSAYSAAFAAADRFTNSQTMLAGIARITGVPLANLQRISQGIARDFKLTVTQANELTAGMNKLTQAAGQPEKMRASVEALLDLGAARGLSTVQVMSAINNALAGMDEGTDKLFMKNPSEIYKKWAAEAGTTVAKMDSLQRAQALLDALLTDGGKVRGEYLKWLETTPGKMQQMETATDRLATAFGRLFTPMRSMLATGGTALANWATDVIERFQRLGGLSLTVSGNIRRLGLAMVGLGKAPAGTANDGPTVTGLNSLDNYDPVMHRQKHFTKDQIDLLAEGYKLGMLTRQEEQERLDAVKQVNAELKKTKDLEKRLELTRQIVDLENMTKEEAEWFTKTDAQKQDRLFKYLDDNSPTVGVGETRFRPGEKAKLRGGMIGPGSGGGAVEAAALAESGSAMDAVDAEFKAFGTRLSQTFSSSIESAFSSKHPLKAFGKSVLAGLGSIFSSMGKAMIMAAPIFKALNAAMHNPFTSSFALLAMGSALVALGSTLGGIATSSGGGGGRGGSGDHRDQITRIILTSPGAGGANAPQARPAQHFTIIGPNDPEAQRALSKLVENGARRGLKFGNSA